MERVNKPLIASVSVLIVLALGVFAYTLSQRGDHISAEPVPEDVPADTTGTPVLETISARHEYSDGTHAVVGTVNTPTPCHQVTAEPFFVGEGEDNIEIQITVVDGAGADEVCTQVITPQRWSARFNAGENATITATLNGDPVRLNLLPVGPGESLDDDIFMKG